MSTTCEICGKSPIVGNSVSHAHNLTKRRWMPNLQNVRVQEGKSVRRMRVCTSCIQAGKVQKASRRSIPRQSA